MTVMPEGFGRSARVIAGVFFLAALLSGCAAIVPQTEELHKSWPANLPVRAELTSVPFFPQEDYQCGPAALATSLGAFQVKVTPEDLIDKVYLPGRQGSLQVEMLAGARRYGMVAYQLAPRYADLLREVASGTPVVVLQDYGVWPVELWHYAVVNGYDREKGELYLRSGTKERLAVPISVFEYTWKESGYWAFVTMPPDRLPVTASENSYLSAIVAMERVVEPRVARTAYRAFLARWPNNLTANVGLANTEHALGDLHQSLMVLKNAEDRNPDSPIVLNNMAQTLSDLGLNQEALTVIDRAVTAAPAGSPFAAAVRDTREMIVKRLSRPS